MMPKAPVTIRPILEESPQELAHWLAKRGHEPFRVRQVRRWIIEQRAHSFDHMTDLPQSLRRQLGEHFSCLGTSIHHHARSDDGTHKLLLRLPDAELIECVLIQEGTRRTACISTQVGCAMGCVFCASGLNGLARNLAAVEILEQLIHLRNLLPATQRLTHVVVMGMGEPLANLKNLLSALRIATERPGLGIGKRHVTISTVGLPSRIRDLADEKTPYHLAVSLHAPNDQVRSRIVPTNERIGLADILAAADYYFETTGRQVTYEYVLLRDLNDSVSHAAELAKLLEGRQAHVNLIPFNDVEGLPYRRPAAQAVSVFVDVLRHASISVKVRKRKGSEIDAACGQLRRRLEAGTPSAKA
jgi:23S rRNA (adenine2503-C2)-methyltransferase